MTSGILLQARTGSTRMPRKVITPFFEGQSILGLILARLRRNEAGLPVYVATTAEPGDDALAGFCRDVDVPCFRGERDDVLARFLRASRAFDLEGIVRVCTDNPFLDLKLAEEVIDAGLGAGASYASHRLERRIPSIRSHAGLFCEWVTRDALEQVDRSTDRLEVREHVTAYVYTHPDAFDIHWIDLEEERTPAPDVRLTVDTPEDFSRMQRLYAVLHELHAGAISADHVLRYLDEHLEWRVAMQREINRNKK